VKEHSTKRKRGRPAIFDEFILSKTSGTFPNVRTKRSLQNNTYAMEGLKIIKKKVEPETFEYFHSEKSTKTSLLSELGRLAWSLTRTGLTMEEIEEEVAGAAEELYTLHKEHGFKVKALVRFCRNVRLNG
jgi:hypothetical protein